MLEMLKNSTNTKYEILYHYYDFFQTEFESEDLKEALIHWYELSSKDIRNLNNYYFRFTVILDDAITHTLTQREISELTRQVIVRGY